jgi:hypothetical protein
MMGRCVAFAARRPGAQEARPGEGQKRADVSGDPHVLGLLLFSVPRAFRGRGTENVPKSRPGDKVFLGRPEAGTVST